MATAIPDSHRDLFERPVLASLAAILPNGQPQVTPVWVDEADGCVRVNTARGRQKHRNYGRPPARDHHVARPG